MNNITKSATEIEEETGNCLELNFSRVPKKNHDAMAQIGKQYVQWLRKHGVKSEIYHLSTTSEVPSGLENIAKTLSVDEEEKPWVSVQLYRDQADAYKVYAKIIQDQSIGALAKEFDGLVTQGKNLITGRFSRLRG